MSNTRLYEITSRSISPFPSVNPTDLLQGLRGGALLSSPLRQECVTRRFSNPLSITIPSLLVLVPFGSRCGSATSERKERLTRGMRAPRLNAARNLSPVVSFRSFEILLPPPLPFFYVFYARVLATRDLSFHVGENKKNFARASGDGDDEKRRGRCRARSVNTFRMT